MLIQGCQTESSPSCLQPALAVSVLPCFVPEIVLCGAQTTRAHLSTVRNSRINARSSKTPVAEDDSIVSREVKLQVQLLQTHQTDIQYELGQSMN